MKQRPVLISAISLTLIIELILIILVYNSGESERLPIQIGRLTVQFILIFWILNTKSNVALFLLTTYHIISGLLILNAIHPTELIGKLFIAYHFGIGLIIYFHDLIETQLKKSG